MGERNRRHILVKGRVHVCAYARRGGGSPPPLPVRHRLSHGKRLVEQLRSALEEAKDRRPAAAVPVPGATAGVYATFEGARGFPLPTETLDRSGATLLSVREEGGREKATVFMPDESVAKFVKKFEGYRQENTKSGKPKHQSLAAPVDSIHIADLRALWTDSPKSFPKDFDRPIWLEIWLHRDPQPGLEVDRLKTFGSAAGLSVRDETALWFPDRTVLLCHGAPRNLARALDSIENLAEVRIARPSPSALLEMAPRDQASLTLELLDRVTFAARDAPAVCILDTGVNRAHPLLAASLDASDVQV